MIVLCPPLVCYGIFLKDKKPPLAHFPADNTISFYFFLIETLQKTPKIAKLLTCTRKIVQNIKY